MSYEAYFDIFNENDQEDVIQHVPNASATAFLWENAPRLYCPNQTIEETFAFRTWTLRKHIKKTEDGFVLSEFLVDKPLSWAGKHNTINAPLTHHLNEYRWMKNADDLMDYIRFFITGEGSARESASAFAYHTPALSAMAEYCLHTGNERFLVENALRFEEYFQFWEAKHLTANGLYWSNDDREGTEYSISGTLPDRKRLLGFRPLMNSCMYGDALALAKIFRMAGDSQKEQYYLDKASKLKTCIDEKLWDGEFYKAIHPLEQDLSRTVNYQDIPQECNVRELIGYLPWVFCLPDAGKEQAFALLKDSSVFSAKTGLATAEISHPRFQYCTDLACAWCGNVWPYATSYAISAVISLLENYEQNVLSNADLYELIHTYAEMHYSEENGKRINFIDEVMLPFQRVWYARDLALNHGYRLSGGQTRGKDYNHSTFLDLVLRGLCGIKVKNGFLTVEPRIVGIWRWFKIENLTICRKTYTVYYDEDGSVFGKGAGVIIEPTDRA